MSEADIQQLRRLLARLVGIEPECWQADRVTTAVMQTAPEFYGMVVAGHGEVCQPFVKHAPTEHLRITLSKRAAPGRGGGRGGETGNGRI